MRWLVVSIAVHALVVWLLMRDEDSRAPSVQTQSAVVEEALPIAVYLLDTPMPAGGSSSGVTKSGSRAAHIGSTRARSADPWSGVSIRAEGAGQGQGDGVGAGTGNGIGFGNGGGIAVARDVPPPPVPRIPPPSKARPPKLIWPTRDIEVEDESYLFVAKVTVDEDGSVVGARMITTRPGSRGEHAANAIWSFRYSPALDDAGNPVRSTLDQPFQVR